MNKSDPIRVYMAWKRKKRPFIWCIARLDPLIIDRDITILLNPLQTTVV